MMTNMDKLYEAVEARGPVCVGLDTDFSYLPADFVDPTLTKGEDILRFNRQLIQATKAVAGTLYGSGLHQPLPALCRKAGQGYVCALPYLQRRRKGF